MASFSNEVIEPKNTLNFIYILLLLCKVFIKLLFLPLKKVLSYFEEINKKKWMEFIYGLNNQQSTEDSVRFTHGSFQVESTDVLPSLLHQWN